MDTVSKIQEQLEIQKKEAVVINNFKKNWIEQYAVVEGVFTWTPRGRVVELVEGYLSEKTTCKTIEEAVKNIKPNQAIHITNLKYIVGDYTTNITEATGTIFDVEKLRYIY